MPSHLYSYSFALNPRWSKTFANQPEILEYLERVAADHDLAGHLRAHTRVTTLRWSDADQRWTVTTDDGATREFDVVVSAVGMLDVPFIPDIPGADRFRGRIFHSSNWDHSKSTAGERIASIGTGASAVQYVPEIARRCRPPDGIPTLADVGGPALRRAVHRPSSRSFSSAIPARRKSCATLLSMPTSRATSPSIRP